MEGGGGGAVVCPVPYTRRHRRGNHSCPGPLSFPLGRCWSMLGDWASQISEHMGRGGGGVGTRPWWFALLACGGAYWPLALEPSAMTSRHPYYCRHPHCCGHPPAWVGIQNATSAHGVLP